jgi:NAD(P)-dependent dehydrogenase (short-subunit alcohol dehydrogenase family)
VTPVRSLFDFSGASVIVTGASRGIGRGIALRFAEAGARVVVHHRTDTEGARDVGRSIAAAGGEAIELYGDLSKRDDARAVVQQTVARFGGVDIVVNNAGSYPLKPLLDMSDDEWSRMIGDDLTSVFLVTQESARAMIALGRPGAIVNITSIEAFDPAPLHSHYDAAKGGVWMYTRASALELGPHGIRVNAIAPGLIDRPGLAEDWPDGVARFTKAAPLGRLGTPTDVADACLFLASPAAQWITGASLVVDGGVMSTQSF